MGDVEQRGAWRPLQVSRSGPESFVTSPFTRLARVHALSTAGDALVAAALSGQLFFSVDPTEARSKVLLYLVLTMAPFAVVSPLIGPALDRVRSGRRWMIVGSIALRAVVCFLMIGDVDGLLLFPEAFAVLVLQKGYSVARSAVVPATVETDAELVEANSKLSLLSGVMGFAAALPGLAILSLGGEEAVLAMAVAVFTAGSIVGLRLPKAPVADTPADEAERAELRSAGVLLAASAMGLLRGIVGFLTFLLAFDLRQEGTPKWQFGLVAATGIAGGLLGAVIAPRLRRVATEERILIGVLLLTVVAGAVSIFLGEVRGAVLLGSSVGIAASAGKLAFDSIVQRDAPDANRGRSFARFETRFQLIWVIGSLIPVVIRMPAAAGFIIVTVVAGFATFSYAVGQAAARHRSGESSSAATARAVEIEARLSGAGRAIRGRMRRRSRSPASRDETPAARR
jgi:hypothetical protein